MKTKFDNEGNVIEKAEETKSDINESDWRKKALEEDIEKLKIPQDKIRVDIKNRPLTLKKRLKR